VPETPPKSPAPSGPLDRETPARDGAGDRLPDFVNWPSFPFEGELRVKRIEKPTDVEPPREGEEEGSCEACSTADDRYIWVNERWRVRATPRPSGLPMVLILETRSHLDLGDLPNLLAAELGVMTVRLERAIRSLDGVARVYVNRWGDGAAHLHVWFMARPAGLLQLRGPFLSMWDDILPSVDEAAWQENLALVAAWLAEFGGRSFVEPPRIDWQAPSTLAASIALQAATEQGDEAAAKGESAPGGATNAQGESTTTREGETVAGQTTPVEQLAEQTAERAAATANRVRARAVAEGEAEPEVRVQATAQATADV
jgi:diadenosine tetraphosphate (Ap4A) HIT family hydrolase